MSEVASTAGDESVGELEQKIHAIKEKIFAIEQVETIADKLIKLDSEVSNPSTSFIAARDELIRNWKEKRDSSCNGI